MIVYAVMYGDFDGGGCCSIWSTREAAIEDIEKLIKEYRYERTTLYIEKWEVDKGVIDEDY